MKINDKYLCERCGCDTSKGDQCLKGLDPNEYDLTKSCCGHGAKEAIIVKK